MGIDHAKGPKPPKLDMYGRPVLPEQKYDMTGKPINQPTGSMQYDAQGQPVYALGKKIGGMVSKVILVIGLSFLLMFGGVFILIFTLMSEPSGQAESFLQELSGIGAESADFHYGSVTGDYADLIGTYEKDGRKYPIWVQLQKFGDDWVVIEHGENAPQEVIDEMNDDI